jgi:acetate kinase
VKILSANVGSTSFKYKLFEIDGQPEERVIASGKVERIGDAESSVSYQNSQGEQVSRKVKITDYMQAVRCVLDQLVDSKLGCISSLEELDGIGFKAVFAGSLCEPVIVSEEVLERMHAFSPYAPLHNPAYIAVMRSFQEISPDVPLVAVFETGFHQTIPDYAYIYSTPYEWYEKYDYRRYGFHGSSFAHIAQRVPQLLHRFSEGLRHIALHLGGSSSVCAIKNGQSVDTSMGFSPQSGLPMGTRVGDIDPLTIPFIAEREGIQMQDVINAIATKGGLTGISGIGADIRDLEMAAEDGNYRASLALKTYVYQVKKYIGAYAAVLDGIDVLSFSGGIGENSANIREQICSGLGYLGVKLDEAHNLTIQNSEALISASDSQVDVLVVPTNEELIVARESARALERSRKI